MAYQLMYKTCLLTQYLPQYMTLDKLCASYLYKRDGTYYFSKNVPCDVKYHCRYKRIVMSVRTKSASRASRAWSVVVPEARRLLAIFKVI